MHLPNLHKIFVKKQTKNTYRYNHPYQNQRDCLIINGWLQQNTYCVDVRIIGDSLFYVSIIQIKYNNDIRPRQYKKYDGYSDTVGTYLFYPDDIYEHRRNIITTIMHGIIFTIGSYIVSKIL